MQLILPTRHEPHGLALQTVKVSRKQRGLLQMALTAGLMASQSRKHCCVRSVWTFSMSLRTLLLGCPGPESASRYASHHPAPFPTAQSQSSADKKVCVCSECFVQKLLYILLLQFERPVLLLTPIFTEADSIHLYAVQARSWLVEQFVHCLDGMTIA